MHPWSVALLLREVKSVGSYDVVVASYHSAGCTSVHYLCTHARTVQVQTVPVWVAHSKKSKKSTVHFADHVFFFKPPIDSSKCLIFLKINFVIIYSNLSTDLHVPSHSLWTRPTPSDLGIKCKAGAASSTVRENVRSLLVECFYSYFQQFWSIWPLECRFLPCTDISIALETFLTHREPLFWW